MSRPSLRVIIVAAAASQAEFASRVLLDNGDSPAIAAGVPEALNHLARESFEVALISLSLPKGDGLALVHHLRALHTDVDVLVMAQPSEIQETAHAMALGVLSTVVLPLTGDGLMVAVDRARERRVLIEERRRLTAERADGRRRSAIYARCAAFVSETDATVVATRVLEACAGELGVPTGAVYLAEAASEGSLSRVATMGEGDGLPDRLEESDVAQLHPTRVVVEGGGVVLVAIVGDADLEAVVHLERAEGPPLEEGALGDLEVISALGAAALSASRKADAIVRTGIKDPETSAYTFAYFGDVAGREIDRATRHGREFSLMTLGLEGLAAKGRRGPGPELTALRRTIVDALLEAIRDSDVLARVEDDELYLLLPESGLLGALACRRRIARRLATVREVETVDAFDPVVGIAVYPSDGGDLGSLLRASRRRAERSRDGVWRRLSLSNVPFWEAVDRLLGTEDDAGIGRDGMISLHSDLRRAHDSSALARHAAMPRSLVPAIAGALADDAVRRSIAGTLYVAGDPSLASAVARAVETSERPAVRAWALGGRVPPAEAARRIHLQIDDPRLDERVLVLSLTELGGYALVAREVSAGALLAYHASDLDLVDGLVSALQSAYHLQPEVR